MMKSTEFALIGGVVKSLHNFESWCGETHIQKTCYVAKVVEAVPFGAEFILYKHGPYSFDLNATLGQMRVQKLLSVTPQALGSTFDVSNGLWAAINKASSNLYEEFKESIDFVSRIFAKKRVSELERVATAVYVRVEFPDLDIQESARKLVELKSHIRPNEALEAFEEAKVFTERLN